MTWGSWTQFVGLCRKTQEPSLPNRALLSTADTLAGSPAGPQGRFRSEGEWGRGRLQPSIWPSAGWGRFPRSHLCPSGRRGGRLASPQPARRTLGGEVGRPRRPCRRALWQSPTVLEIPRFAMSFSCHHFPASLSQKRFPHLFGACRPVTRRNRDPRAASTQLGRWPGSREPFPKQMSFKRQKSLWS